MKTSICIPISEISQVGEARRLMSTFASTVGLSESLRGQVAIIVTELGNNLVKHTHGKGGQLVYRELSSDDREGVEILSLDRGPGMIDVVRCMSDGYSTAGSPGTGLGAIKRLSSVFDIYSLPDVGTALLSQVIAQPAGRLIHFEIGAVCLPIQGEKVSGDLLEIRNQAGFQRVLVVDGLGHGPLAFEAAQEAGRSFLENHSLSPVEQINSIHLALKSTRGAAVAVATIDPGSSLVHYAGLGNIVGAVFSSTGEQRRMVSHNGTAGLQVRRVQEFDYPWHHDSVLVMHSDGLTTHWNIEKYPGLLRRHPSLIAGVLFRDFNRGRDDLSVIVVSSSDHKSSWKGAIG